MPRLDRPQDLARLLTSGQAQGQLDDDGLRQLRDQVELGYDILRLDQDRQARQNVIDLGRQLGEQAVLDRQRESDRRDWEHRHHRWPRLFGVWRRELRPVLPVIVGAAVATGLYALGQLGVGPGETWETLRESWPLLRPALSG